MIFVYIVTILAVTAITLSRPKLIPYTLVFLIPFYWVTIYSNKISLLKTFSIIAFLILILIGFYQKKNIIKINNTILYILLLLVYLLLTLIINDDLSYGKFKDYIYNYSVYYFFIPIAIYSLVTSKNNLYKIKKIIIALGVFEAILAILQSTFGDIFFPGTYFKTIWSPSQGSLLYRDQYAVGNFQSGIGTFHQRGEAGLFLLLPLLFVLSDYIIVNRRDLRLKFTLFIIVLGILFTFSRLSIICTVLSPILITSYAPIEKKILTKTILMYFILCVLLIFILLIPSNLTTALAMRFGVGAINDFDTLILYAFGNRAITWQVSFAQFFDNPLFGIGIGNYKGLGQIYIAAIGFNPTSVPEDHAISSLMEIISQTGIIGMVISFLLFHKIWLNVKNISASISQEIMSIQTSVKIYFIYFMVTFLLAGNFLSGHPQFAYLIALSLVIKTINNQAKIATK